MRLRGNSEAITVQQIIDSEALPPQLNHQNYLETHSVSKQEWTLRLKRHGIGVLQGNEDSMVARTNQYILVVLDNERIVVKVIKLEA